NIFYVNSTESENGENVRIVAEFAGMSWSINAKFVDPNKITSFTQKLFKKSKTRLRAPNKRRIHNSLKSPMEHISTVRTNNRYFTREKSATNLLKLIEKKFYNFSTRKLSKKQIHKKLLSLIKNNQIVNLRIIYELTKSLPKAKRILDDFFQKNKSKFVSFHVEDNLLLEYLGRIKKQSSYQEKLEKLGVDKEKAEKLVNLHLDRTREILAEPKKSENFAVPSKRKIAPPPRKLIPPPPPPIPKSEELRQNLEKEINLKESNLEIALKPVTVNLAGKKKFVSEINSRKIRKIKKKECLNCKAKMHIAKKICKNCGADMVRKKVAHLSSFINPN
ncbi:hypothetical protein MHBO_001271, partial [Bonamia ostreae]